MQVFSFFALCLQPFEIQIHKNLSAKKMKKTFRNICIYQKDGIYLPSNSGQKPERTINIYSLIKNFYYETHFKKFAKRYELFTLFRDCKGKQY